MEIFELSDFDLIATVKNELVALKGFVLIYSKKQNW